jgi:hypothetical protein
MAKIASAALVLLLVFAALQRSAGAGKARSAQSPKGDFDRTIAPLLAEYCLDCHSGAKPKGGLDLTREKAVRKGGRSGPAVVPGKLLQSVLWERVDAGAMPPKRPLGAADPRDPRAVTGTGRGPAPHSAAPRHP